MTALKGVDVAVIRSRLVYDRATGTFTHQNCKYPSYNGCPAGSFNSYGYRVIKIGGKYLLAHQIVWLLETGSAPDRPLDHIDGDKANNRFDNLRLATAAQNGANRKPGSNAPFGVKGVTLEKGRFRARIKVNGRKIQVGVFSSVDEASQAYNEAAKRYFGEFARLNEH